MSIIVTILFLLFGIFNYLYWNIGADVFSKYNLKSNPYILGLGPGLSYVKKYIRTTKNKTLKKKLKRVLLYKRLSTLFFVLILILAILSGFEIIRF